MDKFLIGCKRNRTEEDPSPSTSRQHEGTTKKTKTRKYNSAYLSLGFTSIIIDDEEKPQCLICTKILAADSLKPSKLKRHVETKHPEFENKTVDFFKSSFKKVLSVPEKALLASYKVAYRIGKCKKSHTIGEDLVLRAAIDIVETMFGESFANQLRQIPLADNTVGRRISDISTDLFEQLITNLKTRKFAIQVDEATDVIKDSHLLAYVRFADDENNEFKEDLLFCKLFEERSTAVDLFKIMNNFFEQNNLVWENCIGLCTDGARSMSGKKKV